MLVAVLHLVVLAVLIRAFAPQLGSAVLRPVTAAYDIPLPPPPSPPVPVQTQAPSRDTPAPAGKRATPREVTVPAAPITLTRKAAPPLAGEGADSSAGAAAAGTGTGAGGEGAGQGGGLAEKAVKIAGDIVSARDYPRKTRNLRLGGSVTIVLTVGIDGQVSGCRVIRPSRDPEADRITCRLASERFRFRPARDAAGRPIASDYGWQQRWFSPGSE